MAAPQSAPGPASPTAALPVEQRPTVRDTPGRFAVSGSAPDGTMRLQPEEAEAMQDVRRCEWARNPLHETYHDEEWGVPVHDDRRLFEFIILEGAQAGLSWDTILRKRERYRDVYAGFDPATVARFDRRKMDRLLADPGIVRNRLKIESSVSNARAFLRVQEESGSFDAWLWTFVDGRPVQNRWTSHAQVPASTPVSDRLSKELKRRGFRFVGSTICYAFMQAVGMVNDHDTSCFRHDVIERMGGARA
jgi:DNA-3-methyladenine glycosylase I